MKRIIFSLLMLYICSVTNAQKVYTQTTYNGKTARVYPYKHEFRHCDFKDKKIELPPVTDTLPDGLWVVYKPLPPKPRVFMNSKILKKWEKEVAKLKANPEITAWFEVKNGEKNGSCEFFLDKKLMAKGYYLNNEKDSIWTIYDDFNYSLKTYQQLEYKNGLKDGKFIEVNKNKIIEEGYFKNNMATKTWNLYHHNGRLYRTYTIADSIGEPKFPNIYLGKYHGLYAVYFSNGKLKSSENYIYGYTTYEDTVYYKNGNIKTMTQYYQLSDSNIKVTTLSYKGKFEKVEVINISKNHGIVCSTLKFKKSTVYSFYVEDKFNGDSSIVLLSSTKINEKGDTLSKFYRNIDGSKSYIYTKTKDVINEKYMSTFVQNDIKYHLTKRQLTSTKSGLQIIQYYTNRMKQYRPQDRDYPPFPSITGIKGTCLAQQDSIRILYKGKPLNGEAIINGIYLPNESSYNTLDYDRRFLDLTIDSVHRKFDDYWVIQYLEYNRKLKPKKLVRKHLRGDYEYSITDVTLKDGYFYNRWRSSNGNYINLGEKGQWNGLNTANGETYYKLGKAQGSSYRNNKYIATFHQGKVDGHLVFYNYDNNYISFQGTFKNGEAEGPCVFYNANQDTATFCVFKNSFEFGEIKHWEISPLGERYLECVSTAQNGYLYGQSKEFFPNGNVKTTALYKLEDSVDLHTNNYSDIYEMKSSRTGNYQFYYKNGVLASEGNIAKRNKIGVWKSYSESSKLIQLVDYNDTASFKLYRGQTQLKNHGYYQTFYENGSPKEKGYILNSKYKTDCSQDREVESANIYYTDAWSANGEHMVINGNGHLLLYYPSGFKQAEGDLVNGLREGKWIFYDPNGNPNEMGQYIKGKKEGRWLSGDLKGINFIDNQCFNDEETARYVKEKAIHQIKIEVTLYKNDIEILNNTFNKNLDEE